MRSVYSYNSSFLLSRRSVVCGILHLMSDAVFVIVLYRSLARSLALYRYSKADFEYDYKVRLAVRAQLWYKFHSYSRRWRNLHIY